MNTLSNEDAAYIAGFIDGEGCVTYEKYSTSDGTYYRPAVIIGNTNREVLEWICLAVGCGNIRLTKRKPRHKQGYVVRWACNQAVEVLRQVLPYLKIKGARAKLILGVLSETANVQGAHLPKAFVGLREEVYTTIKTLNQRGVSDAVN